MKLVIKELEKKYTRVVFSNVNVVINDNGLYALVGKNGCGKSTLFKIIKGLEKPTSGSIEIVNDGKIITDYYKYVSYCPSDAVFFGNITVLENLLLISEDYSVIEHYIKLFHLENRINYKMKKLSAGEKCRVCLIRAILENKPIILLDEITKHLDDNLVSIVYEELKKLSKDRIIIFTTHYMKDISQYPEYILEFASGSLKFKDTLEDCKFIDNCYNITNKKIVNKLLNYKPIYLLSFLKWILLIIWIIFVTFLFEPDSYGMYRHSMNGNSYIAISKRGNVLEGGLNKDLLETLNNDSLHEVRHAEGLIDEFCFSQVVDTFFTVEVNTIDIIDNYEDFKFSKGDVVLSDYVYFCLKKNDFIYNVSNYEYFDFFDVPLKIVNTYDTNFQNYIGRIEEIYDMYKIEEGATLNEIISLMAGKERSLKNIFEIYDYSFNCEFIYKRMMCNADTFNLISRTKKINSEALIYRNIDESSDLNYEILSGRLPVEGNEVLMSASLYRKMAIENSAAISDPNMFNYLGQEFVYTITSKTGEVYRKKIKPVGVVQYFGKTEMGEYGEYTKEYEGFLAVDDNLINDIHNWDEYYISGKTYGVNGSLDRKTVSMIYDNGCILVNNKTQSLLNYYNIKQKFNSNISTLVLIISIVIIFTQILSNRMEHNFVKKNSNIFSYTCADGKNICNLYLKRSFIFFSIFISSFLLLYFVMLPIVSHSLSKFFNLQALFLDVNYIVLLLTILILILMFGIEKYFFSLSYKKLKSK